MAVPHELHFNETSIVANESSVVFVFVVWVNVLLTSDFKPSLVPLTWKNAKHVGKIRHTLHDHIIV